MATESGIKVFIEKIIKCKMFTLTTTEKEATPLAKSPHNLREISGIVLGRRRVLPLGLATHQFPE